MMLYPPMNELLKNTESRYLLVNVVARRAREIADDASRHEIDLHKKTVSMAVEEIAAGYLHGEIQSKEEAEA